MSLVDGHDGFDGCHLTQEDPGLVWAISPCHLDFLLAPVDLPALFESC